MTLASFIKTRPSDCFYAAALCLHLLFWNPCVVSGEKRHFNVEVRQMAFVSLPFPAALLLVVDGGGGGALSSTSPASASGQQHSRVSQSEGSDYHIAKTWMHCWDDLWYNRNHHHHHDDNDNNNNNNKTRFACLQSSAVKQKMLISTSSSANAHRCRNLHP